MIIEALVTIEKRKRNCFKMIINKNKIRSENRKRSKEGLAGQGGEKSQHYYVTIEKEKELK